jgi:hypothetical protein
MENNQRDFSARSNRGRGRSNQRRGGRIYGNDTRKPRVDYDRKSYVNNYVDKRNGSNGRSERGRYNPHHHQQPKVHTNEPNMFQLLEQMNNTLNVLVGRVNSLENNKTQVTKTAVAVRPTLPAGLKEPVLHKSNNDDFISVSKAIYKMVQIGHHESNWERLPKSIGDRLDKLIEDINPPMWNDEFRKDLCTLTQQYGEEIRRLVSDHLAKKRVETEMMAGSLNPTDVDRAKEVASKYLTARLGKRLTVQRRTELMNAAASVIGIHRVPPPGSEPRQHQPKEVWTKVIGRTPPKGTREVGANKRKAESIHSTPTENRYSPLASEEMNLAESDVEPDSDIQLCSPPKAQRTPKKIRRHDTDVVTDHKIHIHAGLKSEWEVIPDTPDTCVLVVGDSNLRKVKLIPPYWQINSLPGGDLCDLTDGLSKLSGETKQYTIVLQAGMNHRSNHDADDQADIKSMLFTARRNQSINEIFFNGVSIPLSMPEADAQRLHELNRFMEAEVGSEFYITPLNSADVHVEPHDRWKIHFDQATVDLISRKMIRRITGSDF